MISVINLQLINVSVISVKQVPHGRPAERAVGQCWTEQGEREG